MTRVPMFETFGWACEWNPERGTHTFTRPGDKTIVVRSNAAWNGRDPVQPGAMLPRFWAVERTRLRQLLPYRLKGFGNLTDGGEQGGGSIALHPQWYGWETLAEADATLERHPIANFDFNGNPILLQPNEPYYNNTRKATDSNPYTQLAPYRLFDNRTEANWDRIGGAWLIRAFGRYAAAYEAVRDPVARMFLIVQAFDVMNAMPRQVSPNPAFLTLGTMRRNVALYPHLAKLGTVRWLAWNVRAVAEAYRVCRSREMRAWLVMAVEMLAEGQAASGAFADFYDGEDQLQNQPWRVVQDDGRTIPVSKGAAPSWEMCFLVRALTEAAKAVNELPTYRLARGMVESFLRIFNTMPKVVNKYSAQGYTGLPYYLVTSVDRTLVPEITEGLGKSNPQYEPDVFACAVELGVIQRVPAHYDRVTTLEDSAAVVALRQ